MSVQGAIAVIGDGPLANAVCAELEGAHQRVVRFDAHPALESLAGALAIVITANDDANNVDLALTAHLKHPSLPIVVRVYDPVLEQYLVRTAPGIVVNSMSAIAAPVLAEALSEVGAGVFARWDSPLRVAGLRFDRLFRFVLALLGGLMVVGTIFFASSMKLSVVDALYFVVTTLTTTGYGDISPKDSTDAVKLGAVGFMLAGASTVAMFFAVMADWVFARRLDVAMGRLPTQWSGHVIIGGAGNMSVRVAHLLRDRGLRAIIIEQDPAARGIPALRDEGHHVLIGDATKPESLRLAGAQRAAAVLVLTDNDAHNLHIALLARSLNAAARILARVDSPLLSKHISSNEGLVAMSPVEVAAREFARAAIEKVGASASRP